MLNKPLITTPVRPEFISEYVATDEQALILTPRVILTITPYEDTPPNAPHIIAPGCIPGRHYRHLLFTTAIREAPANPSTDVELRIQAVLVKADLNPDGTFNETTLKDPTIIGETTFPLLTKNLLSIPNTEPHGYSKYGYGVMELFTGIPESRFYRIILVAKMFNVNTTLLPTENRLKILISGF